MANREKQRGEQCRQDAVSPPRRFLPGGGGLRRARPVIRARRLSQAAFCFHGNTSIRRYSSNVAQRQEQAVADVLQFNGGVLAAREITCCAGRGGRLNRALCGVYPGPIDPLHQFRSIRYLSCLRRSCPVSALRVEASWRPQSADQLGWPCRPPERGISRALLRGRLP